MSGAAASGRAPSAPARPVHADDLPALPVTEGQRKMLMLLVILGTIMQALDTTIANVALPHMQGALGATSESINWVLTSYIVAAAVSTPLTGWLVDRFGRRQLLIVSVAMFTVASVLCAAATSLPMMVAARLLQGVFGAFIMPLGQALMLDINPRSKHTQALTLWGVVVMVAPVAGPVLGGWLTDSFNWRWVFLINLPIGLVTTAGVMMVMPRTDPRPSRFDMPGFAFLFLAIAGLQLMLDRGTQADWFDSGEIIAEAVIGVVGVWLFAVHTMTARAPLLPTGLFRDRNLVLASLFVVALMGLVIASSALLPPMLQQLLGYDALGAGILSAPRGIGMVTSMVLAGRLSRKVDPRVLLLAGLVFTAFAMRLMMVSSLGMDGRPIVIAGLIQGLGFGFVALPMNLIAFATIDARLRTQAASLYALARSIGGSIAISVMSALLVRQGQVSHADLAGHVTAGAIPFSPEGGLGGLTALAATFANAEITRQSMMIAYDDIYMLMMWTIVCMMPLVFFMTPPRKMTAEQLAEAAAVE